jgi:hypothetical protein
MGGPTCGTYLEDFRSYNPAAKVRKLPVVLQNLPEFVTSANLMGDALQIQYTCIIRVCATVVKPGFGFLQCQLTPPGCRTRRPGRGICAFAPQQMP